MILAEPLHILPQGRRARPRKAPARRAEAHLCRLLETAVAASFAVPRASLRARSRCRADVAFARQAAMYLAHVAFGLSYSATGRLFGRDRTTAAHACRLVEERRDDPGTDRLLHTLEAICVQLAHSAGSRVEFRA